MTEQEIMIHAKKYIDKLANGVNPLTDEPVAENDIINNVRISRCLFYVSGVLEKDISALSKKQPKPKKQPFFIAVENRNRFAFSDKPITISEIASRVNSIADLDDCKKMQYSQISKWLVEIGALKIINVDNKSYRRPTDQGIELGITTEERQGMNGIYTIVVFDKSAQQFILDNIDAICSKKETTEKREYQGHPWSDEHQACLIELFQKGVPVNEIATTLQRTPDGIRARLKRLGMIENRSDAK